MSEYSHLLFILFFLGWNCIVALGLLWYIDKRAKQRYTKEDLVAYGKKYSDKFILAIKEKSKIPAEISMEDYAIYVKVNNAIVMSHRVMEAEEKHFAQKEASRLLEHNNEKRLKN